MVVVEKQHPSKGESKHAAKVNKGSYTLSQSSKKKVKSKKKILNAPFQREWPFITEATNDLIIKSLKDVFVSEGVAKTSVGTRGGRRVMDRQKKAAGSSEKSQVTNLRSNLSQCLIVGVNAVTRALEKRGASLVIVNRSASVITNHLIDLVMHCDIPAVALSNIAELKQAVGLKSLTTFAFKVKDDITNEKIREVIDVVSNEVPKITDPLEVPQLDLSQDGEHESTDGSSQKKDQTDEKTGSPVDSSTETPDHSTALKLPLEHSTALRLPPDHIDFMSLYVYKKDLPSGGRAALAADFLAFGKDSDSDDDNSSVVKRKRRYMDTQIGYMKYNPDRKSLHKKKK